MIQQFITVDRKKYAVGLFWQPLAVGANARNYARQLSKSVDKKLNAFLEYRSMLAMGARRSGLRMGMLSAAAEAMESFSTFSSFLAAFKTTNGFWLVAVRNGIVVQDQLFEDEAIAKSEYYKSNTMPDWGALFAPNEWGVPRAVERNIADVVTGITRATIKPISSFKASFISAILFLAFVFLVVSFFKEPITRMMVKKPAVSEIKPELVEEYKRQLAEKNKELDEKFKRIKTEDHKPAVPEIVLMPYDLLPDPYERANLCYKAIGFLMQPVPGWNQTSVECLETSATVVFRRDFGNLGDFYEIAPELMPGAFVQEKNESELTVTTMLPLLMAHASMDERDAESVVRDINTLFQRIDTPIDTNIAIDSIDNGTEIVNLSVVEVGVKTKLIPTEFIKIFDGFGGVYLTRIAWDSKSRTWNYEVIIYAK